MKYNQDTFSILFENSRSMKERREIQEVLESDAMQQSIATQLVSKLYTSAVDKGHVDFEKLPDTKGDFTKYEGYQVLVETLSLLKELATAQRITIKEVDTVETAVNNITVRKDLYEKAFAMDNDVAKMSYLTLTYATIAATSALISAYVDFIKTPEKIEFSLIKGKREPGELLIKNLELFNESVRKGEYNTTINRVQSSAERNNLTGASIIFPAMVIAGLMTIVPVSRELIFSFYFTRMKLSDYLAHQSALLELNKAAVEASNKTQKEKKDIIRKQQNAANRFARLSEQIKVKSASGNTKAKTELKKERSTWTLDEVKPDPMADMAKPSDTSSPSEAPSFNLL